MNWNKRVLTLLTLALLVATVSGLMGTAVLGHQSERARVLIAFAHQPGPDEQALVRRAGGTVGYSYHLVPAVAATLPETAIASLLANPNVLRVEPDLRAHAVDTELDNAWGVKRIGSGTVHTAGNKGTGVRIAIVDSGVDYGHPDLNDNYVGGYDFVQDDADPMDVYGHGTHVAGTACAEDNGNGVDDQTGTFGVVGVAPECALYSLRVLDDEGYGSSSDIIAAMQWAVDNSIHVANLSLGWDRDPGATVKAAFDNAWNSGLVTVAAAGNSGNPPGKGNSVIYPAKYDSVIAVAATDDQDGRASFSSTGDEVELAAPGASVFSTWNDTDSHYDPQPVCRLEDGVDTCYKYGSGTSMASPHVAGTAALVIAANAGWTNDQVRTQLQSTADDLGDAGRDAQYGYGLVDADEAAAPVGPIKDIAITSVDAPGSVVQGTAVDINVTVENVGNQDVTSDIIVTLTDETDSVIIGTQTISGGLNAATSTSLVFSWETGTATLGDHTLTASHDVADDDPSNDSKSTVVAVNEETAGVTVTSIDPPQMQAGSTVDVAITGSGFASGADVTFENGSGPAPEASDITVSDSSAITATVTAKSGGPPRDRVWDVRVTNPDGSSGALPSSFTVTP
ncbi:MAG: S8 family serine peptidase [Anaerolineae bacterium]